MLHRAGLVAFIGTMALLSGGCAVSHQLAARPTEVLDTALIEQILRQRPVRDDQDFLPHTLLVSHEFSAHLLQFRTGEQRHVHRLHDLTIVVHRGRGEVYIDDIRRMARAGDVFHIPRGVPHSIRNAGDEPLISVNIFTPPYDGHDSIPAPAGSRSIEREAP